MTRAEDRRQEQRPHEDVPVPAFLLRPPEWFLDIWHRCTDEFLSYDELESMARPQDCPAEAIWECVTALKKHAGVTLPYELYLPIANDESLPGPARDVWYFQSRAMVTEMNVVGELSRESSALSRLLEARCSCPAVLLSLVCDEMLYVLHRDGVEVSPEAARAIWLRGAQPCGPHEELFARLCETFLGAGRYAGREVTRGMIESIGENLLFGAEASACVPARPDDCRGYVTYDPDRVLGIVCRLANGACDDVIPILALHNAEVLMWDHAPLGALNYTVAFVLRRICAQRMGYPVLAYLPFALVSNTWHEAALEDAPDVIPYDITQRMHISAAGYDSTAYQMALLQLDRYGLDRLGARLEAFGRIEEQLGLALATDARLNDRQRRHLLRLVGEPLLQVTIPDYCDQAQVAYSTGRTDLQSLSEMGYLEERYDSRSCVYSSGREFVGALRKVVGTARLY